jgi:hypothetical protein
VQQIAGPGKIQRHPVDLHAPRPLGIADRPRRLLRHRATGPRDRENHTEPPPHRSAYRLEIAA